LSDRRDDLPFDIDVARAFQFGRSRQRRVEVVLAEELDPAHDVVAARHDGDERIADPVVVVSGHPERPVRHPA